jgi:hypothetical protein
VTARRRWLPALAAVALALLAAGCRVDVAVDVVVEASGAGNVEVTIHLDEAAAGRLPDLADQLEVDDLVAAGWVVEGPVVGAGGRSVVRARRAAADLKQLNAALDEVTGPDGAFGDLAVDREEALLHTTHRLAGTVDLEAGLDAFADEALRRRLDGTSVGVDVAELERRAGAPLAQAVRFELTARLPGTAATRRWAPRLGASTPVETASTVPNTARVAWTAAAVVATAVAVVLLVPLARRRPQRGGPPAAGSSGDVAPPP